jgi:AsmA protein
MSRNAPRRRWPIVLAALVLVVVAALVAAVLALDSILLSAARKQADALARDLGRPVTIGSVRTKLRGGLGVRVGDLAIGAGPGEDAPFATLARAEVEADLLKALRSRGAEIDVREAVVEGLRVNVVRFADGTTNAQRIADALARRQPAEPAPAPGEERPPADLSSIRVGRAAIEDARIAFLDRATPGARELAIEDLDVEVRDLAAGRPLELVLRAGVLAPRQNLELRVGTAPLPASLTPTPVRVVLRAQPIDLAPLAPFFPPSAGFLGGRFEADLDAALGAAVPGGAGPTHVKGGFKATALRFQGQEGGRPLDVVLASDLEADVGAGDLRIAQLQLDAGPARLAGRGRVVGFTGASPRVEGLDVTVTGLDPAALAAYYPPLREQVGGRVAGPIGLALRGGGGADAQTVELRIDAGPARLAIPETLGKAAGAPLLLVARVRATGGGAAVAFDATLDAAGVDLRPGGSLAKKPGDPLSAKATGSWRRAGAEQQLELSRLDVDLLGDRLAGKGRVVLGGTAKAPTTRFDAELEGARLDLDRLLLPAPPAAAGKPPAASKPLSPEQFAGLSGEARVKLGTVRVRKLDARNVLARVRVQEDEVTVEEARLDAFGGSVSAAGTRLRLARKDAPFRIVADLKGIAAEQGLAMLWDRKVVSGAVDARLDLSGAGLEPGRIAEAATGALGGALRGGTFLGADLVASVTAPIAQRLPFAASKLGAGGPTSLGQDLGFELQVSEGMARLAKPLQARRAEGDLTLQGGVRLDGTLDMPGTIQLSPDLVARLTGGRARPSAPIPVPFRLAGPAWKPSVVDVGVEQAVSAIVKEAAGRALGAAGVDEAAVAAKRAEAEAAARAQEEELRRKADEQRRAAEERARAEAERARKRVEDEAKKGLEGLFKR